VTPFQGEGGIRRRRETKREMEGFQIGTFGDLRVFKTFFLLTSAQ
jgi:hypothetical protein